MNWSFWTCQHTHYVLGILIETFRYIIAVSNLPQYLLDLFPWMNCAMDYKLGFSHSCRNSTVYTSQVLLIWNVCMLSYWSNPLKCALISVPFHVCVWVLVWRVCLLICTFRIVCSPQCFAYIRPSHVGTLHLWVVYWTLNRTAVTAFCTFAFLANLRAPLLL